MERHVPQLLSVRNLGQFQRFLRLCAARSGQLLNLASLGADCGISAVTAREWLSVLEASYLVTRLAPHHRNFGKRLVKTPKLYFLDVGLMAWLLGIRDTLTIETHAQRGGLQAIEIKSGATVAADWLQGLMRWQRLTGEAGLAPRLVFGGEGQHAREGVEVRGWRAFAGGAGRR